MIKKLFTYYILFSINIYLSFPYPIGIGPGNFNKFNDGGKYNKNNICNLNYNNVYSSFLNWSKSNIDEKHKKKIIDDTLWLNRNRYISSAILLGIYNSNEKNNILNYICFLRKTSYNSYKLLNIFSNPNNNLIDDSDLFENLIVFCNENDSNINFENLKYIDNQKYYFTYIYKYLF